jgi:hypothetical protein
MMANLPPCRREMKLASRSSATILWNLRENLKAVPQLEYQTSIYKALLAGNLICVRLYHILLKGHVI